MISFHVLQVVSILPIKMAENQLLPPETQTFRITLKSILVESEGK